MDGVFKKFGVYDFFGIFTVGVISVTYNLLTLPDLLCFVSTFFNENNIAEQVWCIVLLFAISYFIRVVFQEIGKMIFDLIPFFDGDMVAGIIEAQKNKTSKCSIKKALQSSYDALSPYICSNQSLVTTYKFEQVISDVKYKDK